MSTAEGPAAFPAGGALISARSLGGLACDGEPRRSQQAGDGQRRRQESPRPQPDTNHRLPDSFRECDGRRRDDARRVDRIRRERPRAADRGRDQSSGTLSIPGRGPSARRHGGRHQAATRIGEAFAPARDEKLGGCDRIVRAGGIRDESARGQLALIVSCWIVPARSSISRAHVAGPAAEPSRSEADDDPAVIQGKTIDEWLAALKDRDPAVRKRAVEVLGERRWTRPSPRTRSRGFKPQ